MISTAACCADFYEREWVQQMLGSSLHPGGLDLSRRLWRSLPIGPGSRVLDVACGTGTTAVALAQETGATVVGIDFGEKNLERARERAETAGVTDLVEFVHADAADIPFEAETFDAVICECAVSTFERKAAVIREFHRVLRVGGNIGISDMALEHELPQDLSILVAPWTCVGDSLPVEMTQQLFLDAGLRIVGYEDETDSLRQMLIELKRKLVMASLGSAAVGLADLGLDLGDARDLLARSREAVDEGRVQYFRMQFSRGVPTMRAVPETVAVGSEVPCCEPGCC